MIQKLKQVTLVIQYSHHASLDADYSFGLWSDGVGFLLTQDKANYLFTHSQSHVLQALAKQEKTSPCVPGTCMCSRNKK